MAFGLLPATAPTAALPPARTRHPAPATAPAPWSSRVRAPWLWLVTMPTTGREGQTGTQSFAVRADTLQDAIATAVACSATDHALLHRRGARIDPLRASAVLHH